MIVDVGGNKRNYTGRCGVRGGLERENLGLHCLHLLNVDQRKGRGLCVVTSFMGPARGKLLHAFSNVSGLLGTSEHSLEFRDSKNSRFIPKREKSAVVTNGQVTRNFTWPWVPIWTSWSACNTRTEIV